MAIVADEGQRFAFGRGRFGEDNLWFHDGWEAFFKGRLDFWQGRGWKGGDVRRWEIR